MEPIRNFAQLTACLLYTSVLEELLFRGAITKELLRRYSPAKAILFSGLIFGIFHPVSYTHLDVYKRQQTETGLHK